MVFGDDHKLQGGILISCESSNDYRKLRQLKRQAMPGYKHLINHIVCEWLNETKKRPLRILETHQGEGNATEKYRRYGCVVSFEKDRETYYRMRKRFRDAFSLDACLEEHQELKDIAESYRTTAGYPVLIPQLPTDSNIAIPRLRVRNCRFDVIDVDPYGSPRQSIPMVLELLDDKSVLLTTSGEMHYVRFQPQKALSPYEIRANKRLRSTQKFFRTDNILILGAWIIHRGLERSIGLYPIFVYDYYNGRSGVQRIGFFVRRSIDIFGRSEIRTQLVLDPVLKVMIVRCHFDGNLIDNPRIVWRFCDDTSKEQIEKLINRRLGFLYKH